MVFAIIIFCIILQVFLTTKKVSPFLSLLMVAIIAGLLLGMEPLSLLKTIEKGVGSTLGGLVLIICLGAALGKILEVAPAIGWDAVVLLDPRQKLLIQRFLERLGWLHNTLSISLFGLEVLHDGWVLFVTHPEIVVRKRLPVNHGWVGNFLGHGRFGTTRHRGMDEHKQSKTPS